MLSYFQGRSYLLSPVLRILDRVDCSDTAKAMSSGKVFVFSGILPICGGEDGLATVLGHEIAHNVAHHSAENVSRASLLLPFVYAVSLLFDVSGSFTYFILDYIYQKPGSRKQEVQHLQ